MPEAGVRVDEFLLHPTSKSELQFCKSIPQPSRNSLQCVYRLVGQRHVCVRAPHTTCVSACTDFVGIAIRALVHGKRRGSGSGLGIKPAPRQFRR